MMETAVVMQSEELRHAKLLFLRESEALRHQLDELSARPLKELRDDVLE